MGRGVLRVVTVALGLSGLGTAALATDGTAVAGLEVRAPRAFGYLIGDRFERDIKLSLNAPYRLQRDSLPRAGRLTPWLALEPPRVDEQRAGATTATRIRLRYQLVSVSPEFTDIALPEVLLKLSDGTQTQQLLIPASRLRVGTITDFDGTDLKPAQPPAPLPAPRGRVAAWAALLLAALAGLAWQRWRADPTRGHRPFAALTRRLASRHGGVWQEDTYADALRAIHRAFDTTAGHTVFGESLDGFLADHARFEPLAADIHEFFRRSNAHFYRDLGETPGAAYSRDELRVFVGACAAAERA